MKTSLCFSLLLLTAPVVAQTTPTTPVVPAKFDWKLRLTKGQTWTQTLRSTIATSSGIPDPRTKKLTRMESNIVQNIGYKYEVVDDKAGTYIVRLTYTTFDQTLAIKADGKPLPLPVTPDLSKALVGASLSMTMAPDGHVTQVSGLEDLVARMKRILVSMAKTPAEKAATTRYLPTAATLRATIIKNQSVALPKMPLSIGDSYVYAISLPASMAVPVNANGKRTLRAFDTNSATFDESGTFSVAPTNALSAGNNRAYISMNGTMSGQTVVNAQSGFLNSSRVSMHISGKVTSIDAAGRRTSVPVDAQTQTTVSTTQEPSPLPNAPR